MLDDILEFAAISLVDGGRLSFWMPTANDEQIELAVPMHPCLEVISVCVQAFNKCKIQSSPVEDHLLIRQRIRVEKTSHLSKVT